MRKMLLLASLVAVPAFAQPQPPTPPGPPAPGSLPRTCKVDGAPLLAIDLKNDAAAGTAGFATWSMAVYDSGAVVRSEHDKDGKLTREVGPACMPEARLRELRGELAAAPFVIKRADAACAAISATYTEYRMHGKLVWTQRMCQLDYLDAKSGKALTDVETTLDTMTGPDPLTSSPGKPVK